MRTLVISDLHLAARGGRALLERPQVLDELLAALEDVDRLVLLGDVVELRQQRETDAVAAARPVLARIGAAVEEVVLVAGNHDHALAGPGPLQSAAIAALGTRVEVRYPLVWLRDDVVALHGHYLDRHTTIPALERVGAGIGARVARAPDPRSVDDYEAALAPMYAWIHATTQVRRPGGRSEFSSPIRDALMEPGFGNLRRAGLKLGFRGLVAGLNRAGLGPLRTELSGEALRRANLIAMREVADRLAPDARHVIFGHTHRAGPLPGDDPAEWGRLINDGCWVDEAFAAGDRRSPYRPGFAVRVAEVGDPELINLLEAPE